MKTQYTLLSGETIEFPAPPADIVTYLRRVIIASKDPAVTELVLHDLVHGPGNPLLDMTIVPGTPVATVDVYCDRVFHVMLDCIARKRFGADPGIITTRQRYAMTVPEASIHLGISESAVRQAIASNRLSARKDGGTYYIDPRSVAGYRVSRRGPPRRDAVQRLTPGGILQARIGSGPDASFRVKHAGDELDVEEKRGSEWTGTIPAGWRRIAALGTGGEICRYWEIEPSEGENILNFEGFFLRGGFRVVEAASSSTRARASFRAFVPR